MRFSLIAAVLPALFACNGAIAQVGALPTNPTKRAARAGPLTSGELQQARLNRGQQ